MKQVFFAIILTVSPVSAWAVYQNPTIVSNTTNERGKGHIVMEFTGNAGEPAQQHTYTYAGALVEEDVRDWVSRVLATLNGNESGKKDERFKPGRVIVAQPRSAQAKPDAQVWAERAALYLKLKPLAADIPEMANDVSGLLATLRSTYRTGFALKVK